MHTLISKTVAYIVYIFILIADKDRCFASSVLSKCLVLPSGLVRKYCKLPYNMHVHILVLIIQCITHLHHSLYFLYSLR